MMAPDPGNPMSRRGFLAWLAAGLVFLGTLLTAIPLVGALVAKAGGGQKEGFVSVGPVADLVPGEPQSLTFSDVQQDAYVRQRITRSVWAVKHESGDVVVYSPICSHLGCQYGWQSSSRHFVCPCHNATWTIDGKRVSGPQPRNLDTLPMKVENGTLFVKWVQYQVATPLKIPVG